MLLKLSLWMPVEMSEWAEVVFFCLVWVPGGTPDYPGWGFSSFLDPSRQTPG